MGKSYAHVKAMKQPDRTACWSTSLAWWTHTLPTVKDYREVDILGMYGHLCGSNGGIRFPDGYTAMLSDTRWGMTVEVMKNDVYFAGMKDYFKKGPVMCGYWEWNVSGYHSVALYNCKYGEGVWAMDPNGGVHVHREISYYFTYGKKTIIGYIDSE